MQDGLHSRSVGLGWIRRSAGKDRCMAEPARGCRCCDNIEEGLKKDPEAFYMPEAAREVSRIVKLTCSATGGWGSLSRRK